MGIDKSWMSLRNRACNEYEKGIDIFLDFAFKRLENVKRIRCPCAKCCNVKHKSRTEVKYDLFRNGIMQSYTKWHHHGELSDESSSESDAADDNIPIDQGCRNMEAMLEDLFGHVANSSNTNASDGECTNLRGLGCGPKPLSSKKLEAKPSEEAIERQIEDLKNELKQAREENEEREARLQKENEEREARLQKEKDERDERFKREIEEIKAHFKAEFHEQLKIIVESYGPPPRSSPSSTQNH